MITESEKRQVLLAEYRQRQAEEEHLLSMSKKATRRTQRLMKEIYSDECSRSEADD